MKKPSNKHPGAVVLPTHTPELFHQAVARAVQLLKTGAAVALPTETVYGLAANAWSAEAVESIYRIKDRPAHNPLIVHVVGAAMILQCVRNWPLAAEQLAGAYWPGPLTLVLPRSNAIPDRVTGGGDTVALRWPSHPFIQKVIQECGFPLAAPSANRSNQVSPTTAEHVRSSLGDRIPLIIDGGPAQIGIESTVVDLTCRPPRILRPGMIHDESLAAVVGALGPGDASTDDLKSPGRLRRHYAPRARVVILSWRDEMDLRARVLEFAPDPRAVHILAHRVLPSGPEWGRICVVPHDPPAYARALYSEWHQCDALGARWIVVEAVPATSEWQGIIDRLNRASNPMESGHRRK